MAGQSAIYWLFNQYINAEKAMRRGYRQAPNSKALMDRAVLRGIAEREVAARMRERVAMAGRVRGVRAGLDVAGCLSTSYVRGRRCRLARAGGAPGQSGVKSLRSPVVGFAASFVRRTGGTMVLADCLGRRSRGLPDPRIGQGTGKSGLDSSRCRTRGFRQRKPSSSGSRTSTMCAGLSTTGCTAVTASGIRRS